MKSLALAALSTSVLLAGCSFPIAAGEDCRAGAGDDFLFVWHNKDFFSTAEELAKDRFETVGHDGRFFSFEGTPQAGSGQVMGEGGNLTNVTRADVLDRLKTTGVWEADRDHVVHEAWAARLADGEYDELCQAILAEEKPASQNGDRVGCADGGTKEVEVSSRSGEWNRTVGCLMDASEAEYESASRVDAAIGKAKATARADAGLE